MSSRFVPVAAPTGASAHSDNGPLDWPSLPLASVGPRALPNFPVQLHPGLTPAATLLMVAASVAILWFVLRQRRLGAKLSGKGGVAPLVKQALCANRRFAGRRVVALTYGIVLFGSTCPLPV